MRDHALLAKRRQCSAFRYPCAKASLRSGLGETPRSSAICPALPCSGAGAPPRRRSVRSCKWRTSRTGRPGQGKWSGSGSVRGARCAALVRAGLTLRWSADCPRQAVLPAQRAAGIIRCAGKPSCRGQPLSSNYKGFPICQANTSLTSRAAARFVFDPRASARIEIQDSRPPPRGMTALRLRAKVRTDKLQPVIRAARARCRAWPQTLMKDARGGLIR